MDILGFTTSIKSNPFQIVDQHIQIILLLMEEFTILLVFNQILIQSI
jgi:hypothetical protein